MMSCTGNRWLKTPAMGMLQKILRMDDGIPEEEFFAKYCPPLPDNYAIQQDEPVAITGLGETRHFTNDPSHAEILRELRKAFDEEWFPS